MQVWVNGQFHDRDDASISVFDAGFQHGVGLFETMLARNGRVFRVRAHLDRLAASAHELALTQSLHLEPLAEAVQHAVQKNELSAARVRLTLTGGNLNLLQSTGKGKIDPTLVIVAQPPTNYPQVLFEKGVAVEIANGRDNPFYPMAGHKTLNYWPRIHALQQAAARGASEVVWLTVSNHLSCGSVSNLFLVDGDALLTPIARGEEPQGAIPSPVLPGITRTAIRSLAESVGMTVTARMLDIDDLLNADEVFLTNSSWGVLPVVRVEREAIGDGNVGAVTKRLRQGWIDLVEAETGGAESDGATD